jgi:uncharacterized NAD(P)/FAD-binding protein YdhS
MTEHVGIVGSGFTGTLAAINLRRFDGPRVTLIEQREEAGRGVAYGAAHPTHLLNVRASRMSAFPDEPSHFVRWLQERGVANAASAFIPRLLYGEYLKQLLDETLRRDTALKVVHAKVEDVQRTDDGTSIQLHDGSAFDVDSAILAVGNLPPHSPPGLDEERLSGDVYVSDPWSGSISKGLTEHDTVLILGTGLTMVDVTLMLEKSGFGGRIIAMSRRGLAPHVHIDAHGTEVPITERPRGPLSSVVRQIRARAEAVGWHAAVDELRPFTQNMWGAATPEKRSRFLRHLRPWWDVHRHRIAPEVASELQRMTDEGRLKVVAGRTLSFSKGDGVTVDWRPRGSDRNETLRVRRVINCTGPQGDLSRSTDPLLQNLKRRGDIRPDALRIGIDVDRQSQTINAEGDSNSWLYALGPMTRGAYWEIVAVPDIRKQVWSLARWLSNAHWVGGEGL